MKLMGVGYRLRGLLHGAWECARRGHDWDISYHGPDGSGFDCCRCGASFDSGVGYSSPKGER